MFVIILASIVFYILRRKHRRKEERPQVASDSVPPTPTEEVVEISVIPHPFFSTSPPQEPSVKKKEMDQPDPSQRALPYNRAGEQDNLDPFRDPEIIENQAVPGAGNALDRLQELTREVKEELRELAKRARSGQLSDSERERLDEIKRTIGLSIRSNSRRGSARSIGTMLSAPPPSYRSDFEPPLP